MELQKGHGYHNHVLYVVDIPGYSRAYLCGCIWNRWAITLVALRQTWSVDDFLKPSSKWTLTISVYSLLFRVPGITLHS